MEHVRKRLSCAEANKMDMVGFLATIGFEPQKIKGNEYWYVSPLREEHTPSFKIDRKHNIWYDHGEGKGGNLVDFGIAYFKCNISELLSKLSGNAVSVLPVIKRHFPAEGQEPNRIIITDVAELTNAALLQYGESRAIPSDILKQYCKEVSYTNGGKSFYAIGFKNDQGGYELRSKYFKASSAPKDVSYFKNGSGSLSVFEGFFNFLSFQTLQPKDSIRPSDFLILNSLSFFEKARPIMESYQQTNLYLDTNKAGQKFSSYAGSISQVYRDCSSLYQGHEDLNDFLKSKLQKTDESHKRKVRLKL